MDSETVIRLLREGLLLIVLVSAPPMLASLVVGLTVSILQATTQVQEQTLSFVPKLLAIFLTLAVAGPWMLAQLVHFTDAVMSAIVEVR
ncbi:MAG: flagellar biosynthesis protein FliQ [Acidobacteria bacterium]|nr:flagellar biosynthesis protein FliQ [Acidobacteriota bacterium]